MELEMFNFINTVTEYMDNNFTYLEEKSEYIEKHIDGILDESCEGYLNINSRVKSTGSLKEKIIRNSYYKLYDDVDVFLHNLHDLIGIRVECRFIEDEKNIYERMKQWFNVKDEEGYYYSDDNKDIRLELGSIQPQVQKNGFKIYRIDGFCIDKDNRINFELQIKSLVNVFWGEIEHKIIYKNNNYTMGDDYMKQMLNSIKKNLAMIDNQLLIIHNQYNRFNSIDPDIRMMQLEKLLAKITYEIFATKMKETIGFNVNFRKSCDAIVDYMIRTTALKGDDTYEVFLKILTRLNDIGTADVDFSKEITFEREINFEDQFSEIIGNKILDLINTDFQWYLFFRILFEIEVGNNAEDFETFIRFIKNRFLNNSAFSKLYYNVAKEEGDSIRNSILLIIGRKFKEIGNITFIHEETIDEINNHVKNTIDLICSSNKDVLDEEEKSIYLDILGYNILSVFDVKIDVNSIVTTVKRIKTSIPNSISREYSLEYLNDILGMKKN